jgi:UDP-glucose 4-epimerase
VIGIFMSQLMAGQPMTIFGDGHQTRAFSHIDDVAPAISRCVDIDKTANEVYNIGADKPYTVAELARTVARAFGVEPNIKHLEARNEVVHAYSTHDKVAAHFDLSPFVSLEDGVAEMAVWAKKIGARATPPFTGIEVHKNMPPSWARELTKDV